MARASLTAAELQHQYGETLRELAVQHPTAYKLCQVLRKREPPIFVSDGVAKQWFKKFYWEDQLQHVDNAGHLELRYGDRIRAEARMEELSGATLAAWLRSKHSLYV